MPIGDSIPLTGIRWDDVLFVALAATLLVSALLVVTLRDIIRCGLALIVSFASLAGIYVLLGNPLIAATQVLVYIGAISVLVLFAIMLTQTKNAPARLVFQTQAVAAAVAAAVIGVVITDRRPGHDVAVGRAAAVDIDHGRRPPALPRLRAAVRGRERAADRGRHRWGLPGPARDRSQTRRSDERLARLLPGPLGPALRHRHLRLPGPPQRHQHAHVDRADAQRREPDDRRLRRLHPGAQDPRRGHRPDRDRRRRGRGHGRPGASSSPSTATARRRSSTSTTR